MLCGSFSFAVMGCLAHALGPYCDWPLIALARSVLPLVLALLLASAAGARLVFWRPRVLWLRSIAGSCSLLCTFFALARLPVSDVLTLTNMFPLWVALLSWPLLKEVPTVGVWLSSILGVAGVVLIQQPHFAEGNYATLAALVASVSTAVAMLGLHRLNGIDARAIVAHFSGVALLFSAVAVFLFARPAPPYTMLTGPILLMLAAIGVTATIGQLFLTKAFVAGPPGKVALVGLSQIVFGMILEVLLTERTFQPLTLLGIALVVAPTAWVMVTRE
jgi:drug/metabolite transporter (DMT)-like permease